MKESIMAQIKYILMIKPETRDSDAILMKYFYGKLHRQNNFFDEMAAGRIASFESVRRARQLLQEKNEDLRGRSWYERHNLADEVTALIKKDPEQAIMKF